MLSTARLTQLSVLFMISALGSAEASPLQPIDDTPAAGTLAVAGSTGVSPGARTQGWFTLPDDTSTLTTTFTFLTANAMAGNKVKFTDIVLTGLAASHALTDRLELHIGASFLPKQTSLMDEKIWQSASGSALYALGKTTGVAIGGGTGPLMDSAGRWASGNFALRARPAIEKFIHFDLGLGGNYTLLRSRGGADTYEFSELVTNADLVFWGANRRGSGGALWLGIDFAFPLSERRSEAAKMPFAAQTRSNFHFGAAMTVKARWDLFLKLSVLDRGDAERPETQLPILAGGVDQTLFVVGVSRQFADGDDDRHPPSMAY